MFFRKLTLCVVLFCLVSLFVGVPFAEAHPSKKSTEEVEKAKTSRNNAWDEQLEWNKRYNGAHKAVETLLAAWDDNEDSIKSNKWDVFNTATATAIAVVLDVVLTKKKGDGGATKTDWLKEVVEASPAFLSAINAGKEIGDLINDLSAREAYLLSLNSAVSALDKIILENQAAFDAYEDEYDNYVEKVQDHAGGIVREPNYSNSGDYSAYTAMELEKIQEKLKHKDAYDIDPKKDDYEFWYHIDELKDASQAVDFNFDRFKKFDPNWKLDPLPKKYKCGGGCGLTYRTPVENMVVCPYPLQNSTLVLEGKTMRGLPTDVPLLGQAAPPGSGKMYYLCSAADREKHRIRKCGKPIKGGGKCDALYRNCTNDKVDHGGWWNTYHGPGKRQGLKVYPWDYWFGALPGDSHTAVLSALEPYSSVEWYVASPGVSGRGVLMETDYGDGSSTTAEFTYTFASDASGDYVITGVFVDSNGEETEASYTVSVSGSTPIETTPTPSLSYSLVSSDGVYTATAGFGHEANFTTNEAYSKVYWYVKSPGDTSHYGTNVKTDYGDGSTTMTAQLGYSFPSGVSGDYQILAYVYSSGGSVYETSYTVSVSVPTPTPQLPTVPTATTDSTSYSAGSTVTVTVSSSEAIYGAHLYVSGNLIGWYSGSTTTSSLSLTYTFPDDAMVGSYTIRASVYGWNENQNSWGDKTDIDNTVYIVE